MEYLSIVIPTFNSKGLLFSLTKKITDSVGHLHYEIIFVNDASTDDTWEEIKSLSVCYKTVKGINLKNNMGQQNAVFAGLLYSSGNYIITMDDDLEHDPENIPLLLKKAEEGFDLVYAVNSKKYFVFQESRFFSA